MSERPLRWATCGRRGGGRRACSDQKRGQKWGKAMLANNKCFTDIRYTAYSLAGDHNQFAGSGPTPDGVNVDGVCEFNARSPL